MVVVTNPYKPLDKLNTGIENGRGHYVVRGLHTRHITRNKQDYHSDLPPLGIQINNEH